MRTASPLCREGEGMGRRVAGVQAVARIGAADIGPNALDRRRDKVGDRIGKLEKQVLKLRECVNEDAEGLPLQERARLRREIVRMAERLHTAAERHLDEIAERL